MSNMMFYCPKCKYEAYIKRKDMPRGTAPNTRDGYGRPIFHYQCPKCENLDAGYIQINTDTEDEKEYSRHVIGMYQNIRSK